MKSIIRFLSILLCCTLLAGTVMAESAVQVSEEELASLAPIDQELVRRIEALPNYDAKDTWTVYIYMVGSDLESGGYSTLSDMTNLLANAERTAFSNARFGQLEERLHKFVEETDQAGMKLPAVWYAPSYAELPVQEESKEATEEEEYGLPASATIDLEELRSVELPNNIRFVLQTGGSLTWEDSQINSNRQQRFVFDAEGFREVEDNRVQNMGNPATLESFLRFCEEGYDADHKMLILWNHGEGSFGFGNDEIYGNDNISLKELQGVLENVYGTAPATKPFELIGFDACLMASIEVANVVYKYGNYLVASEELEPGNGWDYAAWVGEFAKNTATNGAKIGKSIVDSFLMQCAVEAKTWGNELDATLSVTDLSRIEKLYTAYEAFAEEALQMAMENPAYLAKLGEVAGKSVKFAQEGYKIYNTIDLGHFMQGLADYFPETGKVVLDELDKTTLYMRNSTYTQASKGLSIYFPTYMDNLNSLERFFVYLEEVSQSKSVNALYFYKIAAFLNEEYQSYVSEKGWGEAKPIKTAHLKALVESPIEVMEDSATLKLGQSEKDLIQSANLAVSILDLKTGDSMHLGTDALVNLGNDGEVQLSLEGRWLGLGKEPLALTIIDSNDDYIKYSSPVYYKKEMANLIFVYDRKSESVRVLGLRKPQEEGAPIDRNLLPLKKRENLYPVYKIEGPSGNGYTLGNRIRYDESALSEIQLPKGNYVANIEFCDLRGDIWKSQKLYFQADKGKISDLIPEDQMQSEE